MGDSYKGVYKRISKNTFKRFERLRKKEDFQRIWEKGKRLGSLRYTLIFVKNHLPHNRLAISISKKIGNAAVRNYEKRICRELYRNIKNSLPLGYDFLLIVKRAINRKSKRESLKDTSSEFLKKKMELKELFNQIN